MEPPPKKVLEQVSDVIKRKHYSPRTEESHTNWIKRFIRNRLRFRQQISADDWLMTMN